MIKNRHIGKFKISDEMINHNPEVVKGIMGQCIIIGARHDDGNRLTEYIAINDRFAEVDTNLPEYKAEALRYPSGEFDIWWKAK